MAVSFVFLLVPGLFCETASMVNVKITKRSSVHPSTIRTATGRGRQLCTLRKSLSLALCNQFLLRIHSLQPANVLTFFVRVTLVAALVRIKQGFTTTLVQLNQQVGASVAISQRNLGIFYGLQILVFLRHRFGVLVVATHDVNKLVRGRVVAKSKPSRRVF